MKEVKLPSGAILGVTVGSFSESEALFNAFLEEVKHVKFANDDSMINLSKELFCAVLPSQKIKKALAPCMKRVTVDSGNGPLRVDDSTFESQEMRADYIPSVIEVMAENISPFLKSLFAQSETLFEIIQKGQTLK